ncbi:hypothetical protein ASG22_16980 [Chryseobacterium sp. Leaf405]|uniref:hypothetical protein n=1 Tax=Chryseobacterium sp. Leaf405 TaxID=1736367 RepID=UPI000701FFBD|nr:hypothetical protein [Chryseobacterium sp. Leaf405]KQT20668.1 hypothetical protein ASG22_16980 [Chryseobacterium sp. Leaf405]
MIDKVKITILNNYNHMKKKYLFIILLLSFLNLINSQTFSEAHYFVGSDEMHVYKQSHDTLYTSTTFSIEPFDTRKYKNHYKIWEVIDNPSDFIVIKLESLDSIPLTTDPYPKDRFKISVYKKKNKQEITLLMDVSHLTKEQMVNYNIDFAQLKNNFGMSLYSLSYMKELLKLKKVTTKKDANKINNELSNPKYLKFAENYIKQNKLSDSYASILTANLINTACLNLGYSPIGASFSISIINSNKKTKEKEELISEFYKRIIHKKKPQKLSAVL